MSNKKNINISVTAGAAKNRQRKANNKSAKKEVVQAVVKTVKNIVASSKKGKRGPSSSGDASNYKLALMDPFNPRALGARLPDEFALPTATYHLHSRFTLSSVGTSTNCSFMFSGQPFQTFMCGGSTNAEFSTAALTAYTSNPTLFYAATETALASKFSTYRVVSSGLRIRGLQPLMTATGRIIVARVPVNTQLPGFTVLENTGFDTPAKLMASIVGISLETSGTAANEIPVNILQLSDSDEFTLGQLANAEICMNNRIISSDAYRMHSTQPATYVSASQSMGITLNPGASYYNTSANAESLDALISAGQSAILVRCEGVPPGVAGSSNPILDVEFIVHVEGVPTVTNSVNADFVPATMQAKTSPAMAQKIIAQASAAPLVSYKTLKPRQAGGRY